MSEAFWISLVAGAVFIGSALGVASLTNRAESAEAERLRQELERRSARSGWNQ